MMADHLFDDERQELFGEVRVEVGALRKHTEPLDLLFLSGFIRWRQPKASLQFADPLCAFEALR
jgi:hypothetical protein